MSPPGRPKGSYRSAQHEGPAVSRLRGSLSCLVALVVAACASAGGAPVAPQLPERQVWHVAAVHCPSGCSEGLHRFLDGTRGQIVEIAPDRFNAAFVDRCDGVLEWRIERRTAAAVVAEMNAAAGPRSRLDARQLGLPAGEVTSATALCRPADAPALPLVRLLSVEPGRVLLLQEEQALLELR